jgi:hypothetical protein
MDCTAQLDADIIGRTFEYEREHYRVIGSGLVDGLRCFSYVSLRAHCLDVHWSSAKHVQYRISRNHRSSRVCTRVSGRIAEAFYSTSLLRRVVQAWHLQILPMCRHNKDPSAGFPPSNTANVSFVHSNKQNVRHALEIIGCMHGPVPVPECRVTTMKQQLQFSRRPLDLKPGMTLYLAKKAALPLPIVRWDTRLMQGPEILSRTTERDGVLSSNRKALKTRLLHNNVMVSPNTDVCTLKAMLLHELDLPIPPQSMWSIDSVRFMSTDVFCIRPVAFPIDTFRDAVWTMEEHIRHDYPDGSPIYDYLEEFTNFCTSDSESDNVEELYHSSSSEDPLSGMHVLNDTELEELLSRKRPRETCTLLSSDL